MLGKHTLAVRPKPPPMALRCFLFHGHHGSGTKKDVGPPCADLIHAQSASTWTKFQIGRSASLCDIDACSSYISIA